ncbi:PP_RS20740 family protein [Mesorhizobium sp. CA16]|uniref:PP_RS20740 family protein n=1 Tax=Mesorhizobium sp. CA16 TaxID=588496 RepID=UPI001CCA73AB|nr:hypothetical protein [Mesorhizobium sp. CA16]MBZ9915358.1 hypothetical protein [Mesorhizobium sp. CA16]
MMATPDDEETAEGLLEVYQPEPVHALAPTKVFAAWHHPRKQFVRIRQWCSEVRKLIPQLGLAGGDPFRYLTLPGNELLDIRALHGVCQPLGVKLRYLGFNSVGPNTPDQAELALSQSEVRTLSSIDEFSSVIEDRLEAVANDRSPASARARQAGPFHAINLDLCDSIAFREVGHAKGSPLEALGKLLSLQLNSSTPWLLFITTKAQPALLGDFARDGFTLAIDANVDASAEFRARLAELVAVDLDQLKADLAAIWGKQDAQFLRLFCLGLGKWLLGILSHAAPPRQLKLLSSCYYQSGPDGPDMLSLAFRCEAPVHAVKDVYAILPAPDHPPQFSEIECALDLSAGVGKMFDLDDLLAGDKHLQSKLIAQAGQLLSQARYSEAEYAEWAEAKFV